jgi:hypothetical protein
MATFNSSTGTPSKPVVNGSSGNWGNLLNEIIDEFDADFTNLDGRIDTLEAVTHVTTFAGLTDTPSSLSGQAGKTLKVNSSGNAIEFVTETVPTNVEDLSNVTVSSPSTGQVLKWNGSAWTNQADASGGGGISVSEARQALSVNQLNPSGGNNAGLSYSDSTGVFTFAPPDLSGYVTSGSPNLTGTPTAPTASLNTNTTQIATTAFVRNNVRTSYVSGTSSNSAFNVVGTYVWASGTIGNTSTEYYNGEDVSGSSIYPAGAISYDSGSGNVAVEVSASAIGSGTWKCMGQIDNLATSASGNYMQHRHTLWLRIA